MENEETKDNKTYRYYAFISYSRKDEATAKWLQKKLESYRLPAVLQKQYENAPKKIKVFRDKTDIVAGGTVNEALCRELEDSKKLIVICSTESAKSEYVELEVKNFLEMGRATTDIIPFVIEGTPKGENDNCFSPTLRSLDINAADATKQGKRDAFIGLLAGLLDIKYDEIKQREKLRLIRKCAVQCASGIAVIAVLLYALWFFIPHKSYFKNYIEHWGVPDGIEKISNEDAAKKFGEYYEITKQYGKPLKLIHKNSDGESVPEKADENGNQNRPMIALYEYKEKYSISKSPKNWGLEETVFVTRRENPNPNEPDVATVLKYSWSQDFTSARIGFYSKNFSTGNTTEKALASDFLSSDGIFNYEISDLFDTSLLTKIFITPLFRAGGAIYQHEAKFDENGLLLSIDFLNKAGQNVQDVNGIQGCSYEYNLDKTVAKRMLHYAENSNTSREENQNGEGKNPASKKKEYEYYYDELGRLSNQKYFGGLIEAKINYNNDNKILTFYFNGEEEELKSGLPSANGLFSRSEFFYDKLGNIVYAKFHNTIPQFEKIFFSEYRAFYNNSGLKIYQEFFDSNGNKHSPETFGYAECKAKDDITGTYLESISYFDENKKLVQPKQFSWAKMEVEETEEGIRRVYYSADGEIVKKGEYFINYLEGV